MSVAYLARRYRHLVVVISRSRSLTLRRGEARAIQDNQVLRLAPIAGSVHMRPSRSCLNSSDSLRPVLDVSGYCRACRNGGDQWTSRWHLTVAIATFCIHGLAHRNIDKQVEQTTYRIYRGSMHVILAVGVLVMLAGDRINWANCATGFLWRTWLFL